MTMSNEDKKRIVYRINGRTSVVQASAITDLEKLGFGIGFLMHHRLYKMSKNGVGVRLDNAFHVRDAVIEAIAKFDADVMDQLNHSGPKPDISDLGQGNVRNPFDFI